MGLERRKINILAILGIVILLIPAASGLISILTSATFWQAVTVLEVVGTIGLSGILAYLYIDIRDIQENQEQLMKVQYEPEIKITISSGKSDYPVILIRNSGLATALDTEIRIQIGSEVRESSHPYLSAEDSIEYPLYVDDSPLSRDEIIDRMDVEPEEDSEGPYWAEIEEIEDELVCSVQCRDVTGEPKSFRESFDIEESLSQLEDFRIRTEVDALESISSNLEDIQQELDDMNNPLTGGR